MPNIHDQDLKEAITKTQSYHAKQETEAVDTKRGKVIQFQQAQFGHSHHKIE